MRKVGVLTFSNAVDNYGQVLQYLATQEYLREKGLTAYLLFPQGLRQTRLRRWRASLTGWRRRLVRFIRSLRGGKQSPPPVQTVALSAEDVLKRAEFCRWADVTERRETESPRLFQNFKNRHFNTFRGTYEDILEHGFRLFCTGSDQMWSGPGDGSLFGWVPPDCVKFSIAPSVGHWNFRDSDLAAFRRLLPGYRFVTVREDNGLRLCRSCGIDGAVKVLDPTFLLPAQRYESYATAAEEAKPFAVVYMLGGEIALPMRRVIEFCQSRGLEVRYVESQGREEGLENIPATVEEWLGLMRSAACVVTNSFHGMAFSIIFRKPFLVFPLTGLMQGMNGRIEDLAARMKLQNRIYAGDMNVLFEPVDWSPAEAEIRANRRQLDKLMEKI